MNTSDHILEFMVQFLSQSKVAAQLNYSAVSCVCLTCGQISPRPGGCVFGKDNFAAFSLFGCSVSETAVLITLKQADHSDVLEEQT